MSSYGWLVDPKRCIECSACEAACKQWNGVETGVGVRLRRVWPVEVGVFPAVRVQPLSLACMHCEGAYCFLVCHPKAITRTPNGTLVINEDRCLGCRECEMFCPYGAPHFNPRTKKMQKCSMCSDRVQQGLEPACSSACPTGALQWGPWEEIAVKGQKESDGFRSWPAVRPRIRFVTGGWSPNQEV
jgi:anaerobic dimethyl sulfoxide reductase subunit B